MLTIVRSPGAGATLHGSAKGDGVAQLVKPHGWRWGGSIGAWYLARTMRDSTVEWKVELTAKSLRANGHDVTVEVDGGESIAEREARRAEAAEERVERREAAAERAADEADALLAQAKRMGDAIPFGQPMLVDHHSYRSDRRYRERMWAKYDAAGAAAQRSQRSADLARATEAWAARRLTAPVTLRRIETLEAELRGSCRELVPCRLSKLRMKPEAEGKSPSCPACGQRVEIDSTLRVPVHGCARGVYRRRVLARVRQLVEEIAYWRQHLAGLEAAGVKLWSRADFAKGDYVATRFGWHKVVRVNGKSLSVEQLDQQGQPYSWTGTVKYDEVRGRRSAAEMAAQAAEVKAS